MTAGESRAGGAWQPIETAPRDGTPVLIAELDDEGWYIDTAENSADFTGEDEWLSRGNAILVTESPSHWMPLPEPPATPTEPKP